MVESRMDVDQRFRCNICGNWADFVVELELIKENMKYNALHTEQMPFYLCQAHECVYKKMQRSIELKDYLLFHGNNKGKPVDAQEKI